MDEVLKQEFNVGLSERGIHVLDPFTGTGTFMVRLLQSGLIRPEDMAHKYQNELHANEIVLLAYYVAAINIEAAFHGLAKSDYRPFDGIVLTDTFQISEGNGSLIEKMFPENNKRVQRQNQSLIRVIVGNLPYSVGQDSQNDGNQNMEYPILDDRISESYAAKSNAGLKRNVYDSYIRAFRWASDRIKDKGVVCFVSNASLLTKNSMDGVRKCLVDEFTSIYSFNLRGDQRTSGELSRMEGGKVFGSGSRTPVAITLLVRNPEKEGACDVYYKDIGDYLNKEEKLKIVESFGSIGGIEWKKIHPSEEGDWLNQRDPAFGRYTPMGEKSDKNSKSIFGTYSFGLGTNRDAWAYNFSKSVLAKNMEQMIDFYTSQVASYKRACSKAKKGEEIAVEDIIDTDPKRISWSRGLKNDVARGRSYSFNPERIVRSLYRPFCKQWVYFDRGLNEMILQTPKMFPTAETKNIAICVVGPGARQAFSALMTDTLPDLHLSPDGAQCFPLYIYEKAEGAGDLFQTETADGYIRRDNIPDMVYSEFRSLYGELTKEDVFYYVYGILHSPEYKMRFEFDLKKQLPRIPLVVDFWKFSKAGRELAQLHLNYESIEPYDIQESNDMLPLKPKEHFKVSKMTFGKVKKEVDRTTIHVNSRVQLTGIPLEVYEYVVNGKSALEWVMERYQVTIDKDSGITNDPNEWSADPRYVVDLIRRVVKLSLESVRIVKSLPPLIEVAYVAEEAEWGLRSKVAEKSED